MATAVAVAGSDARTGRGMMEEPVGIARWKTFSLDGHHYYYDESRKLQEAHAPCMPPKEMTFNLMFFRHVFDHLAKTSGSGSRVSVVALRNMSARLMEKMQVTDPMNIDFFGDIAKKKCTWNDVCKSLLAVGHPRVSLTPTERLFVTLEAEDSSHIAKVWFYIVMTVTIANVSVFIWPKLLLDAFDVIHISDTDAWSLYFKDACMTVFTLDYLLKMACAPFVRLEVVEPCVEYFDIHSWTYRPMSRWERFTHAFKESSNVIDLLAVLPWWCDLIFVHFLPAASFLRILRLARVFRIFKSVRHLDMMQVLGMTLWKSMGMVVIVFTMITIIGLIAACVLQQVERDAKAFDSVLGSWYWTFCRLIGMKDTPHHQGTVTSYWGIAILGCTLTLKGVLWIVPIERIKQIFSKEYADVVQGKNLQAEVVKDVKQIFEDTHEDVEHIVREGPAKYVCAILSIDTKAGSLQGCVPLPISRNSPFDNTGSEMRIKLESIDVKDAWFAKVKIKWTPTDGMEDLPSGQLLVGIAGSKLPAYASEARIEVLVGSDQTQEKKLTLDLGKSREDVSFDIQWLGRKSDEIKKSVSTIGHHVKDLDDFQVQVLQMLREQEDMLQNQMKQIASQSEELAALKLQKAK
ncbi:unnamed protein product [Cladocopium goreaui]|uniref:Potassium voltage-gated channel subfamily D member 2 n=1 Tax=Cladocopium goreaui TaxID=2562237 RepID=A0A9P1DUS0_9DINO|nr:unnamed protein product [Cladocopium goreaui]